MGHPSILLLVYGGGARLDVTEGLWKKPTWAAKQGSGWCVRKFRLPAKSMSEERLISPIDFRFARDTSAVGNGKQRKASADRGPHDSRGRRVL
jgi:hypothetical protein